jgi:hypothetical protein
MVRRALANVVPACPSPWHAWTGCERDVVHTKPSLLVHRWLFPLPFPFPFPYTFPFPPPLGNVYGNGNGRTAGIV